MPGLTMASSWPVASAPAARPWTDATSSTTRVRRCSFHSARLILGRLPRTSFIARSLGTGSRTSRRTGPIIPKIEVQISGTYQSIPGPLIEANVTYTSTQVSAALGRPSSFGTTEVQVIPVDAARGVPRGGTDAGISYGERMHQIDFRVGKILRFGGTRTAVNLDLFNAFNSDAILRESATFATFRNATRILLGRIVKISASIGF